MCNCQNLSLDSLFYAEACNEFVAPISASFYQGNTPPFEEISQSWWDICITASYLIDPRFEPQTSCSRDKCTSIFFCSLQSDHFSFSCFAVFWFLLVDSGKILEDNRRQNQWIRLAVTPTFLPQLLLLQTFNFKHVLLQTRCSGLPNYNFLFANPGPWCVNAVASLQRLIDQYISSKAFMASPNCSIALG